MEYTIGRDAQTRQLLVTGDGKVKRVGQAGSVPMDVSRQHLSLSSLPDGRWQLRNLNNQNVTFVNSMAVESKTIAEGDKVELGQSHYHFPWEAVREPKVETVDIRPLKHVWMEYDKELSRIQKTQRVYGVLASVPMAFSMIGGLITGLVPEVREFALMFTIIAVIVLCIGLYLRLSFDPKKETDKATKHFQRNYICPNPKCGHFMGKQDYDILIQNDACPYCKRKYKK